MTNNAELRFLDGSSSTESYLIIALRGDVALGIRPLGMDDGSTMGGPGNSYLHARLRSAKAPIGMAAQYAADSDHNVVKLFDQKLSLQEAWPNIWFDKVGEDRCSTIFGAHLPGSITTEPELVLQQIEEEDFLGKMARFVVETAGVENMILRPTAIAAWLQEEFDPMFKEIKLDFEFSEACARHFKKNIGVFGFQEVSLNDLLAKQQPALHDPDDNVGDDPED